MVLAKNNNWSSSNRVDIYQLINVVFIPKLSPTPIIKRRLVALISGFWVGRISHRFVFKMKISKYSLDFQGKWCHIALGDSDRGIVRAKLPQWIKRSKTFTFWKFSKGVGWRFQFPIRCRKTHCLLTKLDVTQYTYQWTSKRLGYQSTTPYDPSKGPLVAIS